MHALFDHLARRPVLGLGLAALLALGLGWPALGLRIDNALEVWFVDGDPALAAYRRFVDDFGNDEVVVSALEHPGDPLGSERVQRLHAITRDLAAVDGVARVLSLTSAPALLDDTDGLRLGPVRTGAQAVDADALARVRAAANRGGLASRLLARDGHTHLVYTWLAPGPAADSERPRILAAIQEVVARHAGPAGDVVAHAGMGVMYEAINQATLGQGSLFIGLSYLVIVVALWLVTGRLRWTLLGVAVVGLADLALLGAMTWLGRPVTMYTMALPALVLVLGVSSVVHLAYRAAAQPAQPGLTTAALAAIALPCLLNTLTTAAGFGSLGSAATAITRDFGVFAAVGVVLAFGFFALLFGACARWLPSPRPHPWLRARLTRGALAAVRWSLRHRGLAVGLGAVALVVGGLGIGRLVVDTRAIDFLPDDHGFRRDSARVEQAVGPYLPLELVVELPAGTPWQRAELLVPLARAQRRLVDELGLGRPYSVVDAVHELRAALDDATLARTALPTSDAEVAQLGLLLESDPSTLADLISADGRRLRLTSAVPMTSAMTFRRHGLAARELVQAELGALGRVEVSGYLPLNWQMAGRVVGDQLRSLGLAALIILAVIGLALRSWRLTLAALPSNLVPVVAVLGFMGYAGIRLDIGTVTVAAAVLGIIVDDTLHLLLRTRQLVQVGVPLPAALRRVARHGGAAVLATSLVFSAGFGVIALSSVHSVAHIGLLTAVAVLAALATDLLLLPACLSLLWRAPAACSRLHSVHSARSARAATVARNAPVCIDKSPALPWHTA